MSNVVPIVRDISPRDPFSVAMALRGEPGFVFLDSARDPEGLGRYSYVASNPFGLFTVQNGIAFWNDAPLELPPFAALESLLDHYKIPADPNLPLFSGGAIGFIAYEAARFLERLDNFLSPQNGIPDLAFGFYDTIFVHDHSTHESRIISSGFPHFEDDVRRAYAMDRLQTLLKKIDGPLMALPMNPPFVNLHSSMHKDQFEAAVKETQGRILSGDFFQANIAQRFSTPVPSHYDPFSFYAVLRDLSPAPFGAYLNLAGIQIASNSPELFLRLTDNQIEARPIKGTAPRGDTPERDTYFAETLKASTKDRAENAMIVDLLRNDLSRVSDPGTVKVPFFCHLETYASVHHLVSVVTGQLRKEKSSIDLIKAAFPCGSITGAPKIKAMETIADLEGVPRGIYCGAIGALSFTGNICLNVAIRTVTFSHHNASFHAGGGITALSEPSAEYEETITKASRIQKAFQTSWLKDRVS